MDTVMITGGLGRSGRWIVDRLAEEHFVWCVDLTHPGFEVSPADSIDFRAADLTDRGRAYDLVGELEPDHVVHWAAHPSPTRHSGGEVYETNTIAAYNVLTAAGRAGANIVNASSTPASTTAASPSSSRMLAPGTGISGRILTFAMSPTSFRPPSTTLSHRPPTRPSTEWP